MSHVVNKKLRLGSSSTANAGVGQGAQARPVAGRRVVKGGWLFFGIFFIAGATQIRLQLFEAGNTIELAEKANRYTVTKVDVAKRGTILTANNKPLAEDIDNYELTLVFDNIPRTPAFALELSKASGIPATDFLGLEKGSRTWPQPIGLFQADAIREVRKQWRAKGVSLARVSRRSYPLGEKTSSFIGTIRNMAVENEKGEMKDTIVRTGLESALDPSLKGLNGRQVGLTDKSGALLPLRSQPDPIKRLDGKQVVTTIDSDIQAAASDAVKLAVETNKATTGVAIVLDPKTGDIMAMASWPSYDPVESTAAGTGYNPAYMGGFEPGSTFKVLTLAKALDCGAISSTWSMYCKGELKVGKRMVHCDSHHGVRAHGQVDANKAIAKSCNVSAAGWALKVGRNEFMKYLDELEVFKKSNLGLPGEVSGRFNKKEPAKVLQLATFGFGQSMRVTPVTLAGDFGMLANSGIRMEPRLIKQIGDKVLTPISSLQILKPSTCQTVLNCMESVVETENGTGKTLRIPGYRLGGKTGTAQKVGAKTKGYVSNFVGTVPSQNPRAIVLVMIDDPRAGKYYGADVAGPAFVSIAKAVISRKEIPPTEAIMEPKPKPVAAKAKSLKKKAPVKKAHDVIPADAEAIVQE